ncbi:MAG: helix-turn-helix domain-containing protein [Staphylococcus equorum]|nr:helix-turn-helix domain-containing protein [Staphylococcus equorum]
MELNLKRLKAERIASGITQDEMAHLMGWNSRTPYAKREAGIVGVGANELIRMAEILGYDINELSIFFTNNVPKKEQELET